VNLKILRIINSITLRLPQLIRLRSGIKVATFGKAYNNLFWGIFTSGEYLQLMRPLIQHKIQPNRLIDCGAACGYFSLLVQHLIFLKLLDWGSINFSLVEPNPDNIRKLKINASLNIDPSRVDICEGLAVKKTGSTSFFTSTLHPWGSSIKNRTNSTDPKSIPYIDLTSALSDSICLLKLDIEGGEYEFIETYQHDFTKVAAIIIEWHNELGNRPEALNTLQNKGFVLSETSFQKGDRSVQLFLNDKYLVKNSFAIS
jgi:FkbM family methyltransferase